MGGKTSSKSKNAHTRKAYDRLTLIVQKGLKGYYHNEAKKAGKNQYFFKNFITGRTPLLPAAAGCRSW